MRLLPKLKLFNKFSSNSHYNSSYSYFSNDFQNKISPPRGIFFTSFVILMFFIMLLFFLFFFQKLNFAPLSKIIGLPNFSKEKLHQLTALPNSSSDVNIGSFREKYVKELDRLISILNNKDYHPVSLEAEQKQLLQELSHLKFHFITNSDISETQINNDFNRIEQKINNLNHKYGELIVNKINPSFREKYVKELDRLISILNNKDYHPVSLEAEQKQLLQELSHLKFHFITNSDISETQINNDFNRIEQKINNLNQKYGELIVNKMVNYNKLKQVLPNFVVVPVVKSVN
ncbi:hypothetical protein OC705_01110 ['Bituminaria bituminosa' little leaf phytoplasma]|nr:hypothetical protein ['Bituminaria bituminosa' little leaf phytoplasma]